MISWYNGRLLNRYISEVLDKRYAEFKAGTVKTSLNRAAVDLALSDYVETHSDSLPQQLDPEFKKWAITQLRLMFFVGHDSTSPTICYAFHLLSKNPATLDKLRAEHDQVFGEDVSAAPKLLRESPQLLNQLPYTTAVIKEVLRLFAPASGFRRGKAGFDLHNDKNNVDYPTENTNVWILHSSLHRNPNYWKDPLAFIPERFLVGPEDPLYPVRGAWRPFERGPRDCPGQTLAMLDLRITLVMAMRQFDFKDAYVEWDELHSIPKLRQCTFKGERSYQRGHGGAHPADGMPCRISLRQ
jgi:cytochrome P450